MAVGIGQAARPLIGNSPAFQQCLQTIDGVARHDVNVLIQGESGTGKELVARRLHYKSKRKDGPMVAVNCASLPDALIVNELFGHRRGAYTGSTGEAGGLVQHAEGGTLFLDEIDCLCPLGQAALLRFLQDGRFRRVGGRREHYADVRLVCASNADLQELARTGEFRSDLYYRIDVVEIELPALRNRGEDVLAIAEHQARSIAERFNIAYQPISPELRDWLLAQQWPGNIRELENVMHRILLAGEQPYLIQKAGEERDSLTKDFRCERDRVVRQFEERYLTSLLAETRGNVALAARKAGKERTAFRRLLKRNCVEPDAYRNAH